MWAVEIDQTFIRTGILTEQEFSTVRAQSFSGNWTATFHPLIASGSVKTDQPVTSEIVAEGEDLAISLTRKGILGKISNGKEISAGYEKVVISGGELISLEVPGNQPTLAQGIIEVTFNENILIIVNQITMHQALVSSVSKFGPSSEIEALKAYIIMARSRLAFLKENSLHKGETFDVCDEEHCLPFAGAGHNRELVDILVTMTANQTLEFKGKKIFPRFHHTCGGKTSSAKELLDISDEPYHAAIEDRIDNKGSENCFHSPGFHWSVELSKLDLLDFISLSWAGGADRIFTGWEPLVIDSNGRIVKVLLRGRRPKEINAIEFFENLQSYFGPNSLKSMRFSMEVQRRSVIFRGMGQGIGLGMCLYGADGMAKKGKKCEEILSFYYPGTILK
ncbi:MAG: SpoIID/LytB domain-containing protein [Candidatus Riflebacteria bacterium]